MATVTPLSDRLEQAEVIPPKNGPANDGPPQIEATPYKRRDPTKLPPRPWVYGLDFIRGQLGLIVAPGASGKTALTIGMALAMTTGRPLLGKEIKGGRPLRTWLWNLEDPMAELEKSVEAGCLHWGISDEDLGDRLHIVSGVDGPTLRMAVEDRNGFTICKPVVEAVVAELEAKKIDVLIVDPFVSSHAVTENNNNAIDAVAKEWARVASRTNCAIILVHHTGKLNDGEASAEKARGASALVSAARSVLAINRMTKDEATAFKIEGEDRRRYFRVYNDKANRCPPADKSDWYHLKSISLGNGPEGSWGDSVGVVVPWSPPDHFTGVTTAHLQRIQELVRRGNYRENIQSAEWVGKAVAEVFDLDIEDKGDRETIKQRLKVWFQNEAFVVVDGMTESRKPSKFVRVGKPAIRENA